MKKLIKSPVLQFAVFVVAVVVYAVITGTSVQSVVSDFLAATPLPSPSVTSIALAPTAKPEVKGDSIAATESAVVSEVIDGDTIRLSTGQTLRYIGMDTPETKHPTKGVQCFGKEASAFNEQLVLGKTVQLEKDVSEVDRYGRLLRYVWLDGKMVNETLVTEGYAHAATFPPDVKYQSLFSLAEKDSRENNRGLWRACPGAT